jgi:pimeloyl-ACP methyl ester carboxylesterase
MEFEQDFVDGYISTRHGRLHYASHEGNGPSIIFLHGFAGSIRTWSRLMHHLPEDFNVYLVDLLGHGLSDAPKIDYTVGVQYDSLSDMVDSIVPRKPVLFGHSYGGWIAAYYASERAGVSGLILEDSSGIEEFHEERIKSNPEFREQMIKRALELNPREDVLRSILESEDAEEYLTRSRLGMIEAKALVLWGAADTTVNPKYAQWFKTYIKGSRLEVLKDEKHTPHYTNPAAIAKLVTDFARKL